MSRLKKIVLGIAVPVTALLLAFLILCIVTMCNYSPAFLGRVLTHWDSSVTDYKIFPERIIEKSAEPYVYTTDFKAATGEIKVKYSGKEQSLNGFIESTDTTSFLIAKNDRIVFEKYANGYDANSVNTSFSMAKSIVSLLVGKAVEKGLIKSVKQPISAYITEFAEKDVGKTTIEDLLLMRSRITYDEDKFLWFGDDTLTYWHTDLRELALSHTDLTDAYGGKFHYNNYHPLLLGIILERCTGMSVSEFFEREIWQKIGAESDASWSLDSESAAFEKMESGINFRARDFIKIGSMVLHGGCWNDKQIISGEWLKLSTLCDFPVDGGEYENTFLAGRNTGYKYMWYSTPSVSAGSDIIAWGKSDQILYISPATQTVILRTGKSDGGVADWIEAIKSITAEL